MAHQVLDALGRLLLSDARHQRDERELELSPDHRRCGHHAAADLAQPIQPPSDQLAHPVATGSADGSDATESARALSVSTMTKGLPRLASQIRSSRPAEVERRGTKWAASVAVSSRESG